MHPPPEGMPARGSAGTCLLGGRSMRASMIDLVPLKKSLALSFYMVTRSRSHMNRTEWFFTGIAVGVVVFAALLLL